MHMVLEGLLVSILQRHLGQFIDSDLKSLKVRQARMRTIAPCNASQEVGCALPRARAPSGGPMVGSYKPKECRSSPRRPLLPRFAHVDQVGFHRASAD